MNERDKVLREVGKAQLAIDRLDAALARRVVASYRDARVGLIGELEAAFAALGDEPTAAQVRGLLSRRSLIVGIEQRIEQLMRVLGVELEATVRGVTARSFMAISAEIEILAAGLGVDAFVGLGVDALLELTVGPAIAQIEGLKAGLKSQLTAALLCGCWVNRSPGSSLNAISLPLKIPNKWCKR